MGKPKDLDEAVEMLSFLSGKTHEVATGVSLQCNEINIAKTFSETSSVTFKPISKNEIRLYFKEVNPLDKAGAYAIQTNADMIIDRFMGSYFNVVGLPLESLGEILKELSISRVNLDSKLLISNDPSALSLIAVIVFLLGNTELLFAVEKISGPNDLSQQS